MDSALDALAAEDLHALGPASLWEQTSELIAARSGIDAQIARRIRVAALTQAPGIDGLKSMQSWLRGHARLSVSVAARSVGIGRSLEQLPAVAAAFADGR